jgi:hypothetical protein
LEWITHGAMRLLFNFCTTCLAGQEDVHLKHKLSTCALYEKPHHENFTVAFLCDCSQILGAVIKLFCVCNMRLNIVHVTVFQYLGPVCLCFCFSKSSFLSGSF